MTTEIGEEMETIASEKEIRLMNSISWAKVKSKSENILSIETAMPLCSHGSTSDSSGPSHARQRFAANSKNNSYHNHDAIVEEEKVEQPSLTRDICPSSGTSISSRAKRRYQYVARFLFLAIPCVTVVPWCYSLHRNCSFAEKILLYLTSLLHAIILKLIPYSCWEFHLNHRQNSRTQDVSDGDLDRLIVHKSDQRNDLEENIENRFDDDLMLQTKTYFNLKDRRGVATNNSEAVDGDIIVRNRTRAVIAILLLNLTWMTHERTTTATVIALQLLCWLLLLDVRLKDQSLLSHVLLMGWILGTIFYAGFAGVNLRTGEEMDSDGASTGADLTVIMEYCYGMFFFTCIGMVCKIVGGLINLHLAHAL